MRCEQARQLFDAYLDGELSPALETELGAHRLRCPNCRRELALLEVSGHVLRADAEAPQLPADFTDRLLQCVEESRSSWPIRLRRAIYLGAPLSAAAVIVLAFCGVFDRVRESKVAGVQVVNPAASPAVNPSTSSSPKAEIAFEDWLRQTGENIESGRQTGESLQQVLDGTFSDVLDLLEDGTDSDATPPAQRKPPRQDKSGQKKDDVEDL